VTRGTRASNPLGTCAPRAIQRTAREDAHGIVILDLIGLPRELPRPLLSSAGPFIRDKFGYSNATYVEFRGHVCALKKEKATDTLPSDAISSVFDGSIMSVSLGNRRPPFDNVVVFTNGRYISVISDTIHVRQREVLERFKSYLRASRMNIATLRNVELSCILRQSFHESQS